MIRTIVGFHPDDVGDWVAELSCGHGQHVRHRPPFQDRPWVADPAGRAGRLGTPIECPRCDRAELPAGLTPAGRLGPWEAEALPAGLRRRHRLPEGRWGVLQVRAGRAALAVDLPGLGRVELGPGQTQALPPGVEHRVEPADGAVLALELWSVPPATAAPLS